jgi:hypothetical protein
MHMDTAKLAKIYRGVKKATRHQAEDDIKA